MNVSVVGVTRQNSAAADPGNSSGQGPGRPPGSPMTPGVSYPPLPCPATPSAHLLHQGLVKAACRQPHNTWKCP